MSHQFKKWQRLIAQDVFNQVWQDNKLFLQEISAFGISQNDETSVSTHGQLADAIRDAIADIDDAHVMVHLHESLVCQHVSPPPVDNNATSPTNPFTPLPNNIACSGAQLQNRLEINMFAAQHDHPPKFPKDTTKLVGGISGSWQCQGVHVSAWFSLALHDKMDDLVSCNLSPGVECNLTTASQHMANLFKKPDCFSEPVQDCCHTAALAVNDGCQAACDTADQSQIHQNSQDDQVQMSAL